MTEPRQLVPLEKNTGWIANIAKMLEESLEFKKLSVSLEGISDSLKADISGAGYLMHGNTTGGGGGKVQNMTFNQTINSPKGTRPPVNISATPIRCYSPRK